MDDIKKPEEQVSAAPAELTQAELDKTSGGSMSDLLQQLKNQANTSNPPDPPGSDLGLLRDQILYPQA
jgi:hypothetical protein